MSELDAGAAPAAAEPSSATSEQVVQPQNPIRTDPSSQPADKQDTKEQAKPSARDAIANARKKIDEQEKAEATKPPRNDPKTEQKNDKPADKQPVKADAKADTSQQKVETSAQNDQQQQKQAQSDQQQAQTQKPRYEAPKRFSSDVAATADWEKVPESVQAAVHRVQREMEEGITKYKSSHDRYETIREFDEIARGNGHELKDSLKKVVDIEQAFARNPVEGFRHICDHFGINMRALAAHIAGQKAEDVQVQQEGVISELRRELADLKQQISGVSSGFQKQQTDATSKEVEAFASQPGNERFYDLMGDIAFFLKSDKIDTNLPPLERLKAAYQLADRLNPDPNAKPAPAQASDANAASASDAEKEALAAQTRKGEKSITGAPSAGSDPARREPSSSVKDSLKRAFAQAG
ncbi:hypothetical protein [Agrobacterium tumefaciens]|uniref:hypothetical protein n=1 Tax=Agrobacterium tumefaciens TaxID=358 RepID=UPI001572C073|nr:hypothetical protein [Agrobacterium tumefaciens]NTB01078.1 hypothetical protein [Agrobacterium tumefaciens]